MKDTLCGSPEPCMLLHFNNDRNSQNLCEIQKKIKIDFDQISFLKKKKKNTNAPTFESPMAQN